MNRQDVIRINRQHRANDDSDKWPIEGRFSVVERAIRQGAQFRRDYGPISPEEYSALLDQLESEIVNSPDNLPSIRW